MRAFPVAGYWWQLHSRRRQLDQSRTGDGFTLIELLVTIVILPLIVGALAVALIAVFSQQTSVATRVAGSADAQVTSAVFVTDVQGASNFSTASSPSNSPAQCGTNGTLVFGINWTNGAATPITTVVSYREVAEGTKHSLFRVACQSGTLVSSTAVSHDAPANLTLGNGLTVACGGTSTSGNAPLCWSQAYQNQWITTAGITSIQVQTAEPTTGYTYTLSGTPRAWTPQSSGNGGGGTLPLLLLGNSGYTCSGASSPGISVTGTVASNATADGTINLHDGSQLSATDIQTANTTGNIYSGAPPSPSIPTNDGVTTPDPYLGLAVPTSTTVFPTSVTTLTSSSQPGEYKGAIALSGPPGTTITLPTGIYIFDQGLSLSGNASLQSGPGGVLIYIAGGALSNAGNGGFNLSPIQIPPYTGLTIWQAQGDHTALSLEGNGSGSTVLGAIYAPGAAVGGTGNGILKAGSIVSNGLSCAGNGQMTIN
jgi:Tfp pilus assembly protein FimT